MALLDKDLYSLIYKADMNANQRARLIERAIRLAYDSLQSHLRYTYAKSSEGTAFHKKCVREYAEIISILVKLYSTKNTNK